MKEESVRDEIAGTCDCLEPECTGVKERGECQWNVCNLKLTESVAESLCGKVCVESEQSVWYSLCRVWAESVWNVWQSLWQSLEFVSVLT